MNDLSVTLVESISTLLATIVTLTIIFLVKKATAWIQTKISTEQYNKALKVAVGLWKELEDQFADTPKMGIIKKEKMEESLKKIFPKLTQEELDAINKSVHLAISNGIDGVSDALGVKDLIN